MSSVTRLDKIECDNIGELTGNAGVTFDDETHFSSSVSFDPINIGVTSDATPNSVTSTNIVIGQSLTGTATTATGSACVAIGRGARALLGSSCIAIGQNAYAKTFSSGNTSNIAIGRNSTASPGTVNIAIGFGATASGTTGVAIGQSCSSSGALSTAIGIGCSASGTASVALGRSISNSTNYSLRIHDPLIVGGNDCFFVNATGSPQHAILARSTSSLRYKKNIRQLEDVGQKIDSLNPVRFNWELENVDNTLVSESVGLIAEEVDDLFPEAVTYEEDGVTPTGLRYQDLVPILIKEIQMLRARVYALENP